MTPAIWVAVSLLGAPAVHAMPPPCPAPNRPWVQVIVEDTPPSLPLERTLAHMRAELGPSGIDVCAVASASAPPALATVRLHAAGGASVGISAEVEDAVTRKVLSRTLDLDTTPPQARPLAVALGATELLRASWAETELQGVPRGAGPVPNAVRRVVADGQRERGRVHLTVGLAAAAEESAVGFRQLGVDVRFALEPHERLRLGGRVGARTAARESGPSGSVETSAWTVGVSAATPLTTRWSRVGLDLIGRADAVRFSFVGTPVSGATGAREGATALTAGAGLGSWVRLDRDLQLEVEALAGSAMRGVTATDGADSLVRADGLFVAGALGIAVRF